METQELVDIVDENDEVTGQDLRSNKLKKSFISRVAAVFLVDSDGKFIITKRSEKKKFDPGLLDMAAVGAVMSGETYAQAASRELSEELSISCELEMLDKFYQEIGRKDGVIRIFCAVFLGRTDQLPKLNHEVVEFRKLTFDGIKDEIKNFPEKFCPGFLNDFKQVEEKLSFKVKL